MQQTSPPHHTRDIQGTLQGREILRMIGLVVLGIIVGAAGVLSIRITTPMRSESHACWKRPPGTLNFQSVYIDQMLFRIPPGWVSVADSVGYEWFDPDRPVPRERHYDRLSEYDSFGIKLIPVAMCTLSGITDAPLDVSQRTNLVQLRSYPPVYRWQEMGIGDEVERRWCVSLPDHSTAIMFSGGDEASKSNHLIEDFLIPQAIQATTTVTGR